MTDDIESWVGRTRVQHATLEPELAVRYAAAFGSPLDVAAHFPPLGHWAYFNDAAEPDQLGPDGHPRRGLFLPPIVLPRRMFASSTLAFEAPLELGRPAELTSTIADLRRRAGRQSGEMVLMDQRRELTQGGSLKLTETQTIVYREMGDATPAVKDTGAGGAGELWRPTTVDLFRYSAATYNGHRIHYDQAYAKGEEGYPDLVVHGPFTAAKLFDLASRTAAPLKTFSFRAQAPLFVNQPVRLRAGVEPNTVIAVRCDGQIAMSASYAV
jgi:3-methylfumaryl-CoA hydratase